ncbi:hypothetical protein [Pelomonas sp. SE-A7]|uniref:hypothetical protein n=1 Tax=Pelomonas sp. SE-A7 TaxID=3054953 RepID=UPI00259C936A|nr:hypothetical protein [Pelomonas sp. SE-A7]MDM4766637.1 hypothetical protein [Pelomonas sp. SE-A7]
MGHRTLAACRGGCIRVALVLGLAGLGGIAVGSGGKAEGDDLLFMSNRSENRFEYYRMSADGRNVRRVLAERREVESMRWSPDGASVLYAAARPGEHQNLYLTSTLDGKTRQLTHDKMPCMDAVWAPDGKSIAFVSLRGGVRRIYLLDLVDGRERRLTQSERDDEFGPRFSPDGRSVAYLAATDKLAARVAVADVAAGKGGLVSQVTERSIETQPAWSPDGTRLLFSTKKGEGSQLVLMQADGSARKALTTTEARNSQAQWSPDGSQILFLSVPGNSARQSLFLMNADGTGVRKLHGGSNDVMDAAWSSDGRSVYFVEHLPTGGQVFGLDLSGGEPRRLSGGEGFDVNVQVCCSKPPARLLSSR